MNRRLPKIHVLSRTGVLAGFAAFALLGNGCSSSGSDGSTARSAPASEPSPAVVQMMFRSFRPESVTVHVGQTVEWNNVTVLPYAVVDDPAAVKNPADVALPAGAKPFNSGEIPWRGTYRHAFAVPGAYKYVCVRRESVCMTGTVVVAP